MFVHLSFFITHLPVTLMIIKAYACRENFFSQMITLKLFYSLMNQTQMVSKRGKNKWQISLVKILE